MPKKILYFTAAEFNAKDLKPRYSSPEGKQVEEPTFETEDLRERLRRDIDKKFFILPWGKLYRRDLLVKNKIEFLQMRMAEDVNFCFKCLCAAKKFLRVPQIMNIRRERTDSTARVTATAKDGLRQWLDILLRNIADMDAFMGRLKFFVENPDMRHDVLEHYIYVHFDIIKNFFITQRPHEVYKLFLDELKNPGQNQSGKNIVSAYLFAEEALKYNRK